MNVNVIFPYHGGKWRIAPWIIRQFPPHKVYIEPYGGSGAVLLTKRPSEIEVYNDKSKEIFNVFKVVRENPEELNRLLRNTLVSRADFELSKTPSDNPIEQARRTIIRIRLSFGYGAATPNSPFAMRTFGSIKDLDSTINAFDSDFRIISKRLRKIVLECDDALTVLKRFDREENLFYLDPPYPKSTRDEGDDYSFEMSDEEHMEMIKTVLDMKAQIIISTYPNELYTKMLNHYRCVSKITTNSRNKERTELLYISPNCRQNQNTLLFPY